MRIGFDGKRTTQNFTGLGNYSRYVLRILGQYHPENHYSVFALRPHPRTEELNIPSISFHYPQKQLLKSYWRTYGIVNELKHEGIDLYPNPNDGNMTLSYNLPTDQQGQFIIYDVVGNTVAKTNLDKGLNQKQIDLTQLAAGIYYYRVSFNDVIIATDKIVIVK